MNLFTSNFDYADFFDRQVSKPLFTSSQENVYQGIERRQTLQKDRREEEQNETIN